MSAAIVMGWWLVPFTVTFVSYIAATWYYNASKSTGDYAYIGNGFIALFAYGAFLIVSLIAWLIWAVQA